ncbi:hypothetical protein [Kitasatospora sp. NPDC089509]|uniref:hypothetical protein n=1 Tax=Kitasatospora sp. NPDC089509 TaxID=3364079 RepID=UPI0037F1DEA6
MSRRQGLAAVLGALSLIGTALLGTATPAAAAPLPLDQCTTTSGVILAIDFSKWGGPVLRSCGTTPTTGYELLNQGGWHTTGTGHDGPAFICRIGFSGYLGGKQYPTADQEKCVLTPPAKAYWSYWHADPGDTDWSYSQLGAMSYHPNPGSVDLWIFGETNDALTIGRPTIPVDSLRAHNTAPGGSTTGGSGSGGGSGNGSNGSNGGGGGSGSGGGTAGGSGSGSGGSTTGGSASGGSGHGSGSAPQPGGGARQPAPGRAPAPGGTAAPADGTPEPTPDAPASDQPTTPAATPEGTPTPTDPPTPTDTPSATATSASPTTTVVDAAPTADAPHDSGSVLPLAITVAVALGLGGAAALTARRRRRRDR